MTPLSRVRSLVLVLAVTVLPPSPVRAQDTDINPERLTLQHVLLDAWDPQTGILHGTISGERAGTGGVTVQVLDVTRPRRAPVARFLPGNPCLPVAEAWNETIRTFPGNPCLWGPTAWKS